MSESPENIGTIIRNAKCNDIIQHTGALKKDEHKVRSPYFYFFQDIGGIARNRAHLLPKELDPQKTVSEKDNVIHSSLPEEKSQTTSKINHHATPQINTSKGFVI